MSYQTQTDNTSDDRQMIIKSSIIDISFVVGISSKYNTSKDFSDQISDDIFKFSFDKGRSFAPLPASPSWSDPAKKVVEHFWISCHDYAINHDANSDGC